MSRARRAAAAAAAFALCSALTGCNWLANNMPVNPTPQPTTATSPAETEIQRQMRLDYAAAEKAYRVSVDEMDRLFRSGAIRSSAALRAATTGAARQTNEELLRQAHGLGWKLSGRTRVVGVVDAGWGPTQLSLAACEDISGIRARKNGKDVTPKGAKYYLQEIKAKKGKNGVWKVSDFTTTKLKTLEGQSCATSTG